jgi:hypothetical protein
MITRIDIHPPVAVWYADSSLYGKVGIWGNKSHLEIIFLNPMILLEEIREMVKE